MLAHLCHFGDLVLLLIGDKGAGKTRLIEQLVREEEKSLPCARVLPESLVDAKRLLEQIAESLPAAPWARSVAGGSLAQVIEYFREQAKAGHRTLLIIDDAHVLSEDALDLLVRHFQPLVAAGQLSLLLAAAPGFDWEWQRRVSVPQSFYRVELAPLTAEDVVQYVEARFRSVGWKGNPPLAQDALRRLAEQSKGNPAAIHRLAPALLAVPSLPAGGLSVKEGLSSFAVAVKPDLPKVTPAARSHFPWKWPALAAALLAGSFGLVWFQYQAGDPASRAKQPVTSEPSEVDQLQEPLVLNWPQPESLPWMEADEPEPAQSQDIIVPEMADNNELTERADTGESGGTVEQVDESLAANGATEELSGAGGSAPLPLEQPVPQEQKPQPERLAEPAAPPEVAAPVTPVEVPRQVEQAPRERATAVVPEPQVTRETPQKSLSRHSAFRDQSWLMARPAGRYTIQLLGSYNEQTARSLIDEQSAPDGFWYVKTLRKGQDWYVVLHGEFPNRAAARAAIDRLPTHLKKLQPWMRKFQEIQADAKG